MILLKKLKKAICEKFEDIVNREVDSLNDAVKDKNRSLCIVTINTYYCIETLRTIDENIKDMNRINNSLVKYGKESNISVEELEMFAKRTKVAIYGLFLSVLDKMIAARTEIKIENIRLGEDKITDFQIANWCIPVLESIDAGSEFANKLKTRLEKNSEDNKVDANEFEAFCRKAKEVICEKLKKITERLIANLNDDIKNENGDYGTKKIGKLNSMEACISTLGSLCREIETITKVNASFENKFNLEELENLVQKTNESIYVKFRDFLQSAAVDLKKKLKDEGAVYSLKKIAALQDWKECWEMSYRITAELSNIKKYNYKLGKYAVDLSELLDLVEKAENAIREKEMLFYSTR